MTTSVLTVVGTVAFDTLAHVKGLASPEQTGGVTSLQPDTPGGTAGNVAMALARLDARPRLVSAVGPDFAGSAYANALADAGVDIRGLVVGSSPTSRAYVFYDDDGGQVTYFYAGASAELAARAGAISGGRAHFCAGEIAHFPSLMQMADWVSFDPGQEIFHRDFTQIVACLPHVDLVFANHNELALFEDRGWPLRRLFDQGVEGVVESLGSGGTLVHTPEGRFAAPPPAVRARDPTGAGDAHRAGYLYALDRGADAGVAARFANVLGSFVVEHIGAQAGQPTLAQAIERYQKTYGAAPFA